jgi:hypothetical protein
MRRDLALAQRVLRGRRMKQLRGLQERSFGALSYLNIARQQMRW